MVVENNLYTFPNGLRLVTAITPGEKTGSVVVSISRGTEKETLKNSGITYFLERILTYGTKKYPSSEQLFNKIKSFGGMLATRTTAEHLEFSVNCALDGINPAIEILAEMIFNPLINEAVCDMVKQKVLLEIDFQNANPNFVIAQEIHSMMFARTGLSNYIKGTRSSVSNITENTVKKYLQKILLPKNIVVSVVGDIEYNEVYDKVMQLFYGNLDKGETRENTATAEIVKFKREQVVKNRGINQCRVQLAFPSLAFTDSDYIYTQIVARYIQDELKKVLCNSPSYYGIKSEITGYRNNGIFTIMFATDQSALDKFLNIISHELFILKEDGIPKEAFEKEILMQRTDLLLRTETAWSIAKRNAKMVTQFGIVHDVKSEALNIINLTHTHCNAVINAIIDFNKLYIAYIGKKTKTDFLSYFEVE